MSREEIRQAFKTAVATTFSGSIYVSRLNDNRNDAEFIAIYLKDGEVEHTFSGKQTNAEIVIKYSIQNGTDLALDTKANAIEQAISSHADVLGAVKNPILQRFEYDDESADIASISLIYRILY